MNETIIGNLKQFISATVSQATAGLVTKDDVQSTNGDITALRNEMSRRFDDQDTKLTTIADAHAKTFEDHEQRSTTLKARSA